MTAGRIILFSFFAFMLLLYSFSILLGITTIGVDTPDSKRVMRVLISEKYLP